MKKSLFVIIPALLSMGLCGCDNDKEITNQEVICQGDKCSRIKSITLNEKCPFYLAVGSKKKLSITVANTSKIDDSLKIFNWSSSNKSVVDLKVIDQATRKTLDCEVTAKKTGTAVITAVNTFDSTVAAVFTINVIDLKSTDYLWQSDNKNDKNQFGVDNNHPNGTTGLEKDASATLNGYKWNYERSRDVKLENDAGSIKFGKGCDRSKDEYYNAEDLTLSIHNERRVKSITVETASAYSLCEFSIKVGSDKPVETFAPKRNGNSTSMITTHDFLNGLTGDIELKWVNPPYNFDCDNPDSDYYDINYKGPGAIYLRSIYIQYLD